MVHLLYFGKVWRARFIYFGDLVNFTKSPNLKLTNNLRAYDTEHSIHQIKNLPLPSGGYFAKFNPHQRFPLYGTLI